MRVKFSEIFEDVTRKGRKLPTDQYNESGKYPIFDQGQNVIAGYTDEADGLFTDVPAYIFGDHTRVIKYVDTPCFLGADGVKLLKAKDKTIIPRYLYYALLSVDVPNTGYNRHFKWLKEANIKIVDTDEQTNIVKRLDKIEHLISLRKQQLAKLDELVKARFVEMFGDPVTNPYGWPTKLLLDMGYCKNGMNFHADDNGIEIHCLGVGDFKDFSVIDRTDNLSLISLNEYPPEEYLLKDEDIVFVRSNGNKALVGRCLAVYPHDIPTTYSGFCIRYRRTSADVTTQYLLRVLKMESMRKLMAGRGVNIQNLNQKILAALNIPVPPMELQTQFAAFVQSTDQIKSNIQSSLNELETLKKSLMQTYFG